MRIVAEHVDDCEPQAFWAHPLDEGSWRAQEVEGCGVAGILERVLAREPPFRQEKAMAWFDANLGSRG